MGEGEDGWIQMINARAPSVTEFVCGRTTFTLVPEAPARALNPAERSNLLPENNQRLCTDLCCDLAEGEADAEAGQELWCLLI